ncbi:MAG: hypothetical protein GYB33_03475 [Gammaproteobacteria bacterium]|uniref:hypothetical protein n=1 Tax=Pseudomaricurvus alcaniphilus TaxID=1166482 RepID=UPI00140D8C13|nr:hypothetical protein [Pseudomaricurvus alcaniphilus]MBR9909399.1 hypothetical protein [Gammaproteobacteria bacterium]NHN38336.1 hypothetical protein [Pseudomaricurvus alcaniphilus]
MTNTASATNGSSNVTALGEMVPVDPFRSLYVHFGMLLGVEDFRTMDAYHRGKMWFHSAWLHRDGVIWGLRVSIDQARNEIRVEPGAALDALGRELYLAQPACLNLSAWYEEHKDDPELAELVTTDEESGAVSFDAHVVIQFKACLNRQVPALTEPCDGSNATTAYSRVAETVELRLLPGSAPAWRSEPGQLPYHRVRLLFGLEGPLVDEEGVTLDADQDVIETRDDILALGASAQPAAYLAALREFSALDQMDLTPAATEQGDLLALFPEVDPAPLPLADLNNLILVAGDNGWEIDGGGAENTIRPVHIPTSTIQELVCGPVMTAADAPASSPVSAESPADAGGPRVDPESVTIQGEFIRFTVVGPPLMKASVDARGIGLTAFDVRDGWVDTTIKKVTYDQDLAQVEIELRDDPGGNLVRLIVKGTGSYPFLGRNRIPLAGGVSDGPGSKNNGNDFVVMLRVRS